MQGHIMEPIDLSEAIQDMGMGASQEAGLNSLGDRLLMSCR